MDRTSGFIQNTRPTPDEQPHRGSANPSQSKRPSRVYLPGRYARSRLASTSAR